MADTEILIIGAGAAGLMAARELSRSGKKVSILEARERTGGRILSFPYHIFGYAAEAGAEFVHGDLSITKSIVAEAALTLIPVEGEMWNTRGGELSKDENFITGWPVFINKLKEQKEDVQVQKFLDLYFPEEKYKDLHNSVKGFVEGFDAADPSQASALSLRDEWLKEYESIQYRIKEGYGALIHFLELECLKNNVQIYLNNEVKKISYNSNIIQVECVNEKIYKSEKLILTVPLPLLSKIIFSPPISGKLKAASEIKIGTVIKFLLYFRQRWWIDTEGKNLDKAGFIFSNEIVPTWWTQYPERHPVLTGWLAGPNAEKITNNSPIDILDLALSSLSNIFKRKKEDLKKELIHYEIINWGRDPFALGAYAYATPGMKIFRTEMLKPIDNKIWFSGEALYEGSEIGTVEAALASGMVSAKDILKYKE